jgi:chemotaxis protein methyltransferase CheR
VPLYEPGRAMALTPQTFKLLKDLVNQGCGINYENDKMDLLADKLSGRVTDLGLQSFEEYYYYLRYDPSGDEEWRRMIDSITVNETYFMREADQMKALVEIVLPQVMERRHQAQFTIWSAACSSGEEPYSLAMLLLEHGWGRGVRVIGTDISERVLDRARTAVYGARSLRAMPARMTARYLQKEQEGWRVTPEVRDLVSFRQLNLLDEAAMQSIRGIDAIFCRNVFIYFDSRSVQRVVSHFHSALNQGSYLFVGAAESLLRVTSEFELVEVGGAFAYAKRGGKGDSPALSSLYKDISTWRR